MARAEICLCSSLIASHCAIYANNHNFEDPTRPIVDQGTTHEGITIGETVTNGDTPKAIPPIAVDEPTVKRLSTRGKVWRAVALAVGTLLIVNGSVFGNDVHWPFAPMSQFAFRVGPSDAIRSTFLAAVDEDGMLQRVALSPISSPRTWTAPSAVAN